MSLKQKKYDPSARRWVDDVTVNEADMRNVPRYPTGFGEGSGSACV
jgi:hypothetical protein